MKKAKKVYYYQNYNEDVVITNNQDYKLPKDYKWIHQNKIYKVFSNITYFIAKIFGIIYCKLFLKIKIENANILKEYKNTGYFIYGNHTQPVGDVFSPAIICKSKRIYTIGSTANLGIKGIGKILPMIGILPIPHSIFKMKEFYKAVEQRANEKYAIIIYPEAHVWPYYTRIRPFDKTSFKFPVKLNLPSFCMTTTYYKRKIGKKPGIKIYIDGPFFSNNNLTRKKKQIELCGKVYEQMKKRSEESTYEYIEYRGK